MGYTYLDVRSSTEFNDDAKTPRAVNIPLFNTTKKWDLSVTPAVQVSEIPFFILLFFLVPEDGVRGSRGDDETWTVCLSPARPPDRLHREPFFPRRGGQR